MVLVAMVDVSLYASIIDESRLTVSDAEYCILRAEAGVKIPDGMDAAQAAPLL